MKKKTNHFFIFFIILLPSYLSLRVVKKTYHHPLSFIFILFDKKIIFFKKMASGKENHKHHKKQSLASMKKHKNESSSKKSHDSGSKKNKKSSSSSDSKKKDQKDIPISKHQEQQETKIKKPRRFRPGTVALRDIVKQRKVTKNIIPKAVFTRLMKDVIESQRIDLGYSNGFRCSDAAKYALRECVQKFCTDVLIGANAVTLEQGKQTVDCDAIQMAFTNNNIPKRLTCDPYARHNFETKTTNSICLGVEPYSMHF